MALSLGFGLGLGLGLSLASATAHSQVVISHEYGGNGSAYTNDFVELHNIGSTSINLSGWLV